MTDTNTTEATASAAASADWEATITADVKKVEGWFARGTSAIANALSAIWSPFAKLHAYWQSTDKKTHWTIAALVAVGAFVTWHYGVETVYGWLPDHVTHAEVRSAPFAKAADVAALKDTVTKLNAVVEAQRLSIQDLNEGMMVLSNKLDVKAEAAPAPAPVAQPRLRRRVAKPEPSLWQQITGSTK